eukprot:TRINITY_DN17707_c0_g1_i6.p1 TRINITY_DN17707_c0_g1~~TRINITY_DN17707_c0_g1_i6.p1  ORF type:complete len:478 (+),score=60.39 TRINITY_DN17707_c0_g1_i6:130-1563(+)
MAKMFVSLSFIMAMVVTTTMMMLLVVFVPSVHGSCDPYVATDGTKYNDLYALTGKENYQYKDNSPSSSYTYYYNYCEEVVAPPALSIPTAAAQCGDNNGYCVALGGIGSIYSDHPKGPSNGVTITYSPNNIDRCRSGTVPRTIKQIVNCNPQVQHRFISVEEDDVCSYVFTSESSYACPSTPTPIEGCPAFRSTDGSEYANLYALTSFSSDYTTGTNPKFTWNFCRDVAPSPLCVLPAPATQTSSSYCYQLGYLSHTSFSNHPLGPRFGVNITYEDVFSPPVCSGANRSASLVVTCDPSTDYTFTSVTSNNCFQYNILMRSKHACVTNVPYPPRTSCGKYTSSNGQYSYDLTNLTSYMDYTQSLGNNRYTWNFCSAITATSNCTSPGVSYMTRDSSNSWNAGCAVIGTGANGYTVNDHPSGQAMGVYIQYRGATSDCTSFLAILVATCDAQDTRFVRIIEYSCRVDIYVTSKFACPL